MPQTCEVSWINLAEDRYKLRAPVMKVANLQFYIKRVIS